jgi:hypothetical protein
MRITDGRSKRATAGRSSSNIDDAATCTVHSLPAVGMMLRSPRSP